MGRHKQSETTTDSEAGDVDFKDPSLVVPLEDPIFQVNVEDEQKKNSEELAPNMQSPDWEQYVLKQFQPSELIKGKPKVPGLRRVVRLLIGPIVEDAADPIECPTLENTWRCTAKCKVTVLNTKQLEPGELPYEITFTDASDAWEYNITGEEFARYPVAMACTRSEGRALRKILNLATPAAEEISDVPIDRDAEKGMISESMITRIDRKCEDLNIGVMEFINSQKSKYKSIKGMTMINAQKAFKILGEYERNESLIPDQLIKTYNPNWRD